MGHLLVQIQRANKWKWDLNPDSLDSEHTVLTVRSHYLSVLDIMLPFLCVSIAIIVTTYCPS